MELLANNEIQHQIDVVTFPYLTDIGRHKVIQRYSNTPEIPADATKAMTIAFPQYHKSKNDKGRNKKGRNLKKVKNNG